MGQANVVLGPALGVAGVLAVVVAAAVGWWARLGTARLAVIAGVRAVVQLGAVALLIGAIVGSVWLSALFVLLMIAVAGWTAARRITTDPSGWWAVLPIAVTPLPVVALLVLGGVVPHAGIAIIPMAGSLIGGTMTATAQAGRRTLDELEARHGEVEAALSLGFLERDARMEIVCPNAVRRSCRRWTRPARSGS
jgi:putative ABC transport system permease protein